MSSNQASSSSWNKDDQASSGSRHWNKDDQASSTAWGKSDYSKSGGKYYKGEYYKSPWKDSNSAQDSKDMPPPARHRSTIPQRKQENDADLMARLQLVSKQCSLEVQKMREEQPKLWDAKCLRYLKSWVDRPTHPVYRKSFHEDTDFETAIGNVDSALTEFKAISQQRQPRSAKRSAIRCVLQGLDKAANVTHYDHDDEGSACESEMSERSERSGHGPKRRHSQAHGLDLEPIIRSRRDRSQSPDPSHDGAQHFALSDDECQERESAVKERKRRRLEIQSQEDTEAANAWLPAAEQIEKDLSELQSNRSENEQRHFTLIAVAKMHEVVLTFHFQQQQVREAAAIFRDKPTVATAAELQSKITAMQTATAAMASSIELIHEGEVACKQLTLMVLTVSSYVRSWKPTQEE